MGLNDPSRKHRFYEWLDLIGCAILSAKGRAGVTAVVVLGSGSEPCLQNRKSHLVLPLDITPRSGRRIARAHNDNSAHCGQCPRVPSYTLTLI